jgi:hypothetical protein
MFALLPLAMVIALILNAPSLWEAFNDPQVDLFPVLFRLLIVALLADIVLYVANRALAGYLAHPRVDVPITTEIIVGEVTPVHEPVSPTISVATVAEISPPPLTGDSESTVLTTMPNAANPPSPAQ